MTEIEKTIMQEIAELPESRKANVLAYVRSLRVALEMDDKEVERRFDMALKSIRARAKKLKITQKDIDEEIRAVRESTLCCQRRQPPAAVEKFPGN